MMEVFNNKNNKNNNIDLVPSDQNGLTDHPNSTLSFTSVSSPDSKIMCMPNSEDVVLISSQDDNTPSSYVLYSRYIDHCSNSLISDCSECSDSPSTCVGVSCSDRLLKDRSESRLTSEGSESVSGISTGSCNALAQQDSDDNGKISSAHPFEGVEKRLIVQFDKACCGDLLLNITIDHWNEMLVQCGCKIVSVVYSPNSENPQSCLYLLSESTMLVEQNRVTVKTCGTTRPLFIIDSLVDYLSIDRSAKLASDNNSENDSTVSKKVSPEFSKIIRHILYSREDFLFPKKQLYPHRSEAEENAFLAPYFPVGNWATHTTPGNFCNFRSFVGWSDKAEFTDDFQLVEVAMRGVYSDCVERFAGKKENAKDDRLVSAVKSIIYQLSGCSSSVEDQKKTNETIDEFWFEPCGYSANAFTLKSDYIDIHIAPEPEVSYGSFETSAPFSALVAKSGSESSPIRKLVRSFGASSLNVSIVSAKYILDDQNELWMNEFRPLQLRNAFSNPLGPLTITRLEFEL